MLGFKNNHTELERVFAQAQRTIVYEDVQQKVDEVDHVEDELEKSWGEGVEMSDEEREFLGDEVADIERARKETN